MNTNIRLQTLLVLVLLGLSACSSLQTTTTPQQPLAANQAIEHWQLRGKIGIRDGQQANSAYINWSQCADAYDIKITGPLGQGAAHIYGDQHGATLENHQQQTFYAADPEQLLQQQFGWYFPVSQLVYWLRAIPAPDEPYHPNTDNHGFTQSGWQLNYPQFTNIDGFELPAKIIAKQPPLQVTLILKQWQLQHCGQTP